MKLSGIYLQGARGKMGQIIASLATEQRVQVLEMKKPQDNAVLIDFSSPEGTREALEWCVAHKTPMVSGTTGLTDEVNKKLLLASKKIPVLWSANMSLGVHIMAQMISALSTTTDEYDYHIEETHHKRKVDSPSGTALYLKKSAEKALQVKKIDVQSVRAGGVFGIHKFHAIGEEEMLTIEHQALSRKVFARGALHAAAWILEQDAGLYNMSQVLGLHE